MTGLRRPSPSACASSPTSSGMAWRSVRVRLDLGQSTEVQARGLAQPDRSAPGVDFSVI